MRKQASYQSWAQRRSRSQSSSPYRNKGQRNMDLTGLKWIKNVTDPRPEVKWAYHPDNIAKYPDIFHANWDQRTFGLNWPTGEETNAEKPQAGELILLKQSNNKTFYITHLVELLDNDVRTEEGDSDHALYRMVKIIWTGLENPPPPTLEEICHGNMGPQQGGDAVEIENTKVFKEYWNQGHGGLTGFQEHIRQVLNLN